MWRAGLSSAPSQMLQHMAVPLPAAAPCHKELQGSSWLRIATELGLNTELTRNLNFCGMVLVLLISYSKLSQSLTTPEVLKAGLELTGAVGIIKHSQNLGGNTKSCLSSTLPIRAQLAEAMLIHFCANSTNLIVSPSSRSKKAAPSSDTRKYVNQQFRRKMIHKNTFSL